MLLPLNIISRKVYQKKKTVRDILEANGKRNNIKGKIINWLNKVSHDLKKYTKPNRIGTISKGGQGERIYSIDAPEITLSASSGGCAPNTGAYLINGNIRELTPRECARLQGFPDSFIIPVAEKQALQQFGNSLPINIIQCIIKELIEQGIINQLSKKNKYKKCQNQKLKIKKTEVLLPQVALM